ncbi:MAG: phosphoribosylformylglycinamidine synthase subunit PurL [Blastocatellia bacterium]|nr:phosphoribosylformylglycinamidine synthase subunit PurL [Blastocatellia bacterium]
MTEQINKEVVASHGLTEEEFERIKTLLGRTPNITELGIFSVMWSEHCSYKSSRVHLKRLPTKGDLVVQGPGENAGIIDIGEDWSVAFKIESHNHPSFIEPYQGAATGVGGILRDIFTMGARPLAILDSLRFGSVSKPLNKRLVSGVVKGISDYGNSFGCPTIGGETVFADCYSNNPLVNVFALGLVRRDQIFLAKAGGIGNSVIYVGAKTGRDGIHGATMASAEFDESTSEKRPTVQVGDPFYEKLLLEACLEAMRTGAIVGIQDMGAAGLTSSSCEMGARAGTGIDLELSLVPQRETGMNAYEIMLSESQERMLIVAEPGRERELIEIFNKWELDAVVIGKVTSSGHLRVFHHGQLVADIPNDALTNQAPAYNRPMKEVERQHPSSEELRSSFNLEKESVSEVFHRLIRSFNLCSRRWIYQQYDHMVRTNTVVLPGSDAAVIRLKETRKAVAMTLDGNGRYCHLNPKEGAKLIIAEACRNLVVSGARPVAATNCLNFASPERPEVMWSFSQIIDGMSEACKAFNTPITGGNVSFYNETEGQGIYPTPIIGMVGIVDEIKHLTTCGFKQSGDLILVLGQTREDLGGSEYLAEIHGKVVGDAPRLDIEKEKAVQKSCLEAIQSGLVTSAHDVSDGGLLVALAESAIAIQGSTQAAAQRTKPLGAKIDLNLEKGFESGISLAAALFGESPSRIILTVKEAMAEKIEEIAQKYSVVCTRIGTVGGSEFIVSVDGQVVLKEPVLQLYNSWLTRLDEALSEQ